MATGNIKQSVYQWEGKDRKGKLVKGEMRANGEAVVNATLRRQGITILKVKKQSALAAKGKVTEKDITLFTRQLATMMKAGVPLLQAFDIVGKGRATRRRSFGRRDAGRSERAIDRNGLHRERAAVWIPRR